MKRIDMTERMENAIDLAAKCWDKAIRVEPDFVVEYLSCAEELLTQKPKVMGDEFRAYCLDRKLYRPSTLHHNVWVSGVTVLHSIGWIQPIGKVIPQQSHNHMPEVTLWKSMIFDNSVAMQKDMFGI
jgi:hypothetical protein